MWNDNWAIYSVLGGRKEVGVCQLVFWYTQVLMVHALLGQTSRMFEVPSPTQGLIHQRCSVTGGQMQEALGHSWQICNHGKSMEWGFSLRALPALRFVVSAIGGKNQETGASRYLSKLTTVILLLWGPGLPNPCPWKWTCGASTSPPGAATHTPSLS